MLMMEVKPELLDEWSDKNEGVDPKTLTFGSGYRAWWRCREGHEWQAEVKARIKGGGCPYCKGYKAWKGINDLATLYPDLVKEWSDRNGDFKPDMVTKHSARRAWWKCSKCGYEWNAIIFTRSKQDSGCPACSNHVRYEGFNDLKTKYPELAKEWSSKNLPLKPKDVKPGSKKLVWWTCNEGHEWQARIFKRVQGAADCPYCVKHFHNMDLNARIRFYAKENDMEYTEHDDSITGLPLAIYFPKHRAAIHLDQHRDLFEQEYWRQDVQNDLCKKNDIFLIRIQYPGAKQFPDCVCIEKADNGWESADLAIQAAFRLILDRGG
ncbi:MAG: zinc-ribbon domain-containing protein [Lachnospiraceae bacterium]|nr:zinc-ribbon domain-containing protein [Lachnospiraceae bacterium]